MGDVKSKFDVPISRQLVLQAQQGQLLAHEHIYNLFSSAVYHLALNTLKHPQVAEDIMQNTFINVLNKAHQFRFQSPFGMWIRKITVNQVLMHIRKHNKNEQSTQYLETDDNIIDLQLTVNNTNHSGSQQAQIELDLLHSLAKLPVQTRTVLWLKEVEGYTHREIGQMMGKTASYSKSLVARAYELLRKRHHAAPLKENR